MGRKIINLMQGEEEPEGVQVGHFTHPDDFEVFFLRNKETDKIHYSYYIPSKDARVHQGCDGVYEEYKNLMKLKGLKAVQPLDKDVLEALQIAALDGHLAGGDE